MNNQQIKQECEALYKTIQESEDKLREIRKVCKHEKTFEGEYSYRPGASLPALICEFCGECVKLDLFTTNEKALMTFYPINFDTK
jgi:hypothetical protein